MTSKKINIDWAMFQMAFSRDSSFSNFDENPYLIKCNGAIIWIFNQDEDANLYGFNPDENKYHREKIENSPEEYLLIESTSHNDHHMILLSFLDSDWTSNNSNKMLAKECYQNSISGWKANIRNNDKIDIDPEIIIDLWHRFVENEMDGMMKKFLTDNGVKFEWC